MSIRATATFNLPLTTYAQGIAQDKLAGYRLANLICPIVQVPGATGKFKKFDDKNSFVVEDTARALGGPRKRLQFEATDGDYNCKPHGLEIGQDDFEMDLTGSLAGSPVGNELLAQGKVASMVSRKVGAYVNRIVAFVAANLTPVANSGNWSNNDIDPIDQIDFEINRVATIVGTTDNIKVIVSLTDWIALRRNAQVKKRLALVPGMGLTKELFTGALAVPVQLEISAFSLISAKWGQTGGVGRPKAQVMAGSCLVLYSVPTPGIMDASAFKCFSTSSVLVDAIRTYREEANNSDMHAMDWSEDIEQTGTACASLLAIT